MNNRSLPAGLVLAIFFALVPLAGAAAGSQPTTPVDIVQAVYSYHLSHEHGSADKTIKSHRQYFTPALLAMLAKEWSKPSKPDEVPDIDWDILTASQDFPLSFKVGKLQPVSDGKAKVEVKFLWSSEKTIVDVYFSKTKEGWQISDLYYPSEKEHLSDELRTLNKGR
jgi:hypothetical protein